MADSSNHTEKEKVEARPRRIGVFGGSFDPIHIGHLAIAQEALWQCELDLVLFIVAALPPHKKEPEAAVEHRLRMVELAVDTEPAFHPSRIEIERGGASYTAETLTQLHREYSGAAFFLIVGADSAIDFSSWKDPEAVIEMANVVIAPRPGFDLTTMEPRLQGKAQIFQSPTIELSSTMIRKRLHDNRPIRFLVPDVAERYIRQHGLYSD
jgi:nicotinate-nucleotide adenylyltransferase